MAVAAAVEVAVEGRLLGGAAFLNVAVAAGGAVCTAATPTGSGTNVGSGAVAAVVVDVTGAVGFGGGGSIDLLTAAAARLGGSVATFPAMVCTSAIAPHPTSPHAKRLEIGATCW